MKKSLVALVIVGVVALAGAMPASAQETVSRVNVPFTFIVGDNVLPAGNYTVSRPAPDLLTFQSADNKVIATVVVQPTGEVSQQIHATLAFNKIGGQYFLAKVGIPGAEGRALLLPKARVAAMLAKLNGAKAVTGPAL